MKFRVGLQMAAAAAATGLIAVLGTPQVIAESASEAAEIEDGTLGFVVHEWGNAGARGPTVCPNGRSMGYRQIFEQSPQGKRKAGESDGAYSTRLTAGGFGLAMPNGRNLCSNPELAPEPDKFFRTMDDPEVVSYGIDLDNHSSSPDDVPATNVCPHSDFPGINGQTGIDNQYLRLVGCTGNPSTGTGEGQDGWLPPPQVRQENTMLEGGWGILIQLKGVDNLQNDDSVEVGVYANADPIVLSSSRDPLPFATYAADQDRRFRGETRGRIKDGVLTTEPVNVRFHWLVAGFHLERPIDHARIMAKFNDDGVLEGYLAGYTPIEAVYDFQYGFRNAKNGAGQPVPIAQTGGLAAGAASAMNRTCNGAYEALHRLADGDPDPETGRCTSISTQYFFRATPSFVVDVQTHSVNEGLLDQ